VRAVDRVMQTQTNRMKEAIAVTGHLPYHGLAVLAVALFAAQTPPNTPYLTLPFSRNAGIQTGQESVGIDVRARIPRGRLFGNATAMAIVAARNGGLCIG
jgi:hypothetical protein